MRGWKTYAVAGLLFVSSGCGLYFKVPLEYAVYGLGIFVAAGLVTLRLAVKDSWGAVIKVYADRSKFGISK